MTDLATTIPAQTAHRISRQPAFLPALRGAWLFTWKPRLTLRRLPGLLVSLLLVPVLAYLTTSSTDRWLQRQSLFGNPAADAQRISRHLQPEQAEQLQRIFADEYARAMQKAGTLEASQTSFAKQYEQLRICYDRIQSQVRDILNPRQFEQFQAFKTRKLLEAQRRASLPVWNRTAPFYHWLVDFYFFAILPLSCVGACGALIREELQANTLGFLLTRPLSRARLIFIKYLSQVLWLELVVIIEAGLFFAAGYFRQTNAWSLLPLFLTVQFLSVLAWSALGTMLGLLTKRYMAWALLYGFIVEMGIGRIPTNINTLSLIRHLKSLLSLNPALQAIYDWPARSVAFSVGALLVASALFVGLSALIFTLKEYHHTAEMQK